MACGTSHGQSDFSIYECVDDAGAISGTSILGTNKILEYWVSVNLTFVRLRFAVILAGNSLFWFFARGSIAGVGIG